VGTVVAQSDRIARALVRHVAGLAPHPIGIDAFESLSGWTGWLAAAGFAKQRPLARMMRPAAHGPALSEVRPEPRPVEGFQQFSIFGPEFA
jgi:hypothetical protein